MSDTHLREVLRTQLDDLRARGLYKQERVLQGPQTRNCAHMSGSFPFSPRQLAGDLACSGKRSSVGMTAAEHCLHTIRAVIKARAVIGERDKRTPYVTRWIA